MGVGASTRSTRVSPTVAAQISVQPISVQPAPAVTNDSVKNIQANVSAPTSERNSSDDVSQLSKRSSLSGSAYKKRGLGSAKKFSQAGAHSRPISSVSKRNITSAKGFMFRGGEKLTSPVGLPLQRDIDLNASGRTQRTYHMIASPDSDVGNVIWLRTDTKLMQEKPATCCQLCGNQFTTLGIRVPFLLLCGHSYCSNCLERACENYPSALKCGICSILTSLDQQTPESLPQNEAVLNLLSSKEYISMSNDKNVEKCAECEHQPASMYCSECSASYCDFCGKKAHHGSRVRAKHKPVPINLKPRPQPTCKKHPGQSCVLYCETEKQPMCVLCKFYGQHRFHRYELLSKVASKYCSSVTEKLNHIDKMEKEMDGMAQTLSQSVEEIDSSARKAQERLERHFAELRKSYLASMERREAVLLTLVDRQVEVKQEMLEEMRLEIAAARSRVLAAKEEAAKLLQLNPISALLSRKHMDASLDKVLKETALTPQPSIQPEVPLSLLPDITPGMAQTLSQHGAILQLPPKPWFVDVSVTCNNISLQWEVMEHNSDVTADRTLTYSLHCYADVPFKLKAKLNLKKRFMGKLVTPESGFEDMSEYSAASSQPQSNFPSLPPSLLGSRNISLVTVKQGDADQPDTFQVTNQNVATVGDRKVNGQSLEGQMAILQDASSDDSTQGQTPSTSQPSTLDTQTVSTEHEPTETKRTNLVLKPTGGKNITSLLPEPIRLPKPADNAAEAKLPQLVKPSGTSQGVRPPTQKTFVSGHPNAVLNLPPLIITKPRDKDSETELFSDSTTSGVWADSEDTHCAPTPVVGTFGEDQASEMPKMTTGSSSTLSEISTAECTDNQFTNVGRYCNGHAFEEIHCGEKASFHYSGLVAGATYFFRVRCHNAAGWGPWSDTIKCMTRPAKT